MPTRHVIRPGDSVIQLSEEHGHFAPTIWDHPDNADLKRKRADMNILMEGDVVMIPDRREKTEEAATGRRHVFRRRGVPAIYRLQLFEHEQPIARAPYRLFVDGVLREGQTNDRGVLEEYVPPRARVGELYLQSGATEHHFRIQFGHLDPLDEPSGVRKRLENLGYDCSDPGTGIGPRTKAALKRFQERVGLEITGDPDAATLAKLEELHGQVGEFPAGRPR